MSRLLWKQVSNQATGLRLTQAYSQPLRVLSSSARHMAANSSNSPPSTRPAASRGTFSDFSDLFPNAASSQTQALNTIFPEGSRAPLGDETDETPAETDHHMHVYSHKHNTHITLTRPNREPMISLSCGNLGFRKSHRGKFEAAYQLAAYVFNQITNQGWLNDIKRLELTFRGFGEGRSAVTKAIMGLEGRLIRDRISKVGDTTRLRQGGTRAPRPRRLG